MKTFLLAPIAIGLALSASASSAAVVFSDDFSSYGAVSAVPASATFLGPNWVSTPTVDYLAAGSSFGGLCQGTGNCVDLDGTTPGGPASGLLSTTMNFGPGIYNLAIHLLGSGRNSTEEVTISFGDWSTTVSGIASSANLMLNYNVTTAAAGVLSFQNTGGDNVGAVLTSVTVTDLAPVPLPAGGLLLLTGLAGIAAARRRKG